MPLDETETRDIISSLDFNKSSGPFCVPNCIFKKFAHYLANPITRMINQSLTEGKFPNILKFANVCPIYKKGDKNKCEKYRPIFLLSNLSKIFDRAMHSRLYKFFDDSNLLFDLQFRFRKSIPLHMPFLA